MAFIQAAGDWDAGEVIHPRMISGCQQIEDIKRIAALQTSPLTLEEREQIQLRRAQAAERKDLLRAQAESSHRNGEIKNELQAKLAQRRRALEESVSKNPEITAPLQFTEELHPGSMQGQKFQQGHGPACKKHSPSDQANQAVCSTKACKASAEVGISSAEEVLAHPSWNVDLEGQTSSEHCCCSLQ